ncbi:nucleotide exchange factor GrpE [Amphritea sp. HPY]|uniref:nucleotide exchange factor GrpE n=1 Tax=Amphritea sp. HPY TaxID=3421652 RepID=UPI003D7EF87E
MAGEDKAQTETVQPEAMAEDVNSASDAADFVEPAAEADVDALQLELAKAKDTISALVDQELRTKAEMQNLRRRAEQDVEKAHKFALEKFTNELLPVIDSLERAVEACNSEDEAIQAIAEGVEMTLGMFVSGIGKFNVEQHDPLGDAFDPALHQAMSMVPNPEVPANNVMAVMQKGYSLNGRLIRPAMVIVSKGAE